MHGLEALRARPAGGGYLIHRWFFVCCLLEKRVCHPLVRSDPKIDPPDDPKSTENALHVPPLVEAVLGVPRGSERGVCHRFREKKIIFLRGRGVPPDSRSEM